MNQSIKDPSFCPHCGRMLAEAQNVRRLIQYVPEIAALEYTLTLKKCLCQLPQADLQELQSVCKGRLQQFILERWPKGIPPEARGHSDWAHYVTLRRAVELMDHYVAVPPLPQKQPHPLLKKLS